MNAFRQLLKASGAHPPVGTWIGSAQPLMSQFTSAWMLSTYSMSSLAGFVSSMRRLHLPPNSRAMPKFRQMLLAWPMWR